MQSLEPTCVVLSTLNLAELQASIWAGPIFSTLFGSTRSCLNWQLRNLCPTLDRRTESQNKKSKYPESLLRAESADVSIMFLGFARKRLSFCFLEWGIRRRGEPRISFTPSPARITPNLDKECHFQRTPIEIGPNAHTLII